MPQDIALVGATLIDGLGGPPLPNARLLIRGREILAVGPSSRVGIPDGARMIDVSGRTLLPGLIDGHVQPG